MNLHKANQSGSLIHKLQLLQSHTNRVVSQHEKLNKLIANPNYTQNFQQIIEQCANTMDRTTILNEAVTRMKNHNQYGFGNSKWHNKLSKNQAELKQAHLALYKIREQLTKMKQKQLNSNRNINKQIQISINQIKQSVQQELEGLRKNVNKFLNNTKQEVMKNHQTRIVQFAERYLQNNYESSCEDIQAQIGLLICQLQYFDQLQNQDQIVKRIKLVQKIPDRTKNHEKQQLELGKLQRQIIVKNLQIFVSQSTKRIAYDSQLLGKKIELGIECIRANAKNKHKRDTFCSKYEKESNQFSKRIQKLQCEYDGMKIKIKQMLNKLKVLNAKIATLNGEKDQTLNNLDLNFSQLELNLKQCVNKLKVFTKLKAQYIYFS